MIWDGNCPVLMAVIRISRLSPVIIWASSRFSSSFPLSMAGVVLLLLLSRSVRAEINLSTRTVIGARNPPELGLLGMMSAVLGAELLSLAVGWILTVCLSSLYRSSSSLSKMATSPLLPSS